MKVERCACHYRISQTFNLMALWPIRTLNELIVIIVVINIMIMVMLDAQGLAESATTSLRPDYCLMHWQSERLCNGSGKNARSAYHVRQEEGNKSLNLL